MNFLGTMDSSGNGATAYNPDLTAAIRRAGRGFLL
jgi:hypothetical protein